MPQENLSSLDQSRRRFLQTSGTLAAGAAVAPLFLPTSAQAEPDAVLRLGLIGCGGRGSGAANQALQADSKVHLVAVGDVFESQAQESLKALKTQQPDKVKVTEANTFIGLDAYQKVIDSGVDVVILATPPGFRPLHLKAAVAAGKHVFCEKPVAVDAPGVRSVLESAAAAKKKNLSIVAGFCWRYDVARQEFYKRIHEGAVGEIKSVYASYLSGPVKPMKPATERPEGMSDVEWQLRNWYNFVWLCGDGYVEQAVHNVDKVAWAMNDVMPLKAIGLGGRQTPNHEGNIYDHMNVVYEFPNQVRATVMQRQIGNCYFGVTDYITGTLGLGSIQANPIIEGKNPWHFTGEKEDMYQYEHNQLFAAIRKGEPINDGVRMANSTMMAIMGRMSAYTGQEVTWEQAINSKQNLFPEDLQWNMKLPIVPMAIPGKTKII